MLYNLIMEILGNIHSIETFGTVDGPGIRFVVFFKGCPMRCLYCHNPDTWGFEKANEMKAEDILEKYEGVKEFLKNGGITATGGEPLAQIDFLIELFKKSKEKNIHTALDTSGILFNQISKEKIDTLLKYTDLVLLDIKHIDPVEHKKLTSFDNKNVLDFARYLSDKNIAMWVRHVVVPDITYNEKYLKELGCFLKTLKNVKALDVLPYHNLAIEKYENLKLDYPLKNTLPLDKKQAIKARDIILEAMKSP